MSGEARFEELCDDLLVRHDELERTKMMGMPSLKRNGKLGFIAAEDTMVFKLPEADARERALAIDGAHLVDPGRRGRPMKESVVVPPARGATGKHAVPHATERAARTRSIAPVDAAREAHADRWPEPAEAAIA